MSEAASQLSSYIGLHVGELAEQAGVTPATVRYYARIGLLNPGREAANGYRRFAASDCQRLVFIRKAQTLGLTIGDVKSVLQTVDDGSPPCDTVQHLVEERLAILEARVAELRATEARMRQALLAWDVMANPVPEQGELCPLIERLNFNQPAMPGPAVAARGGCGCVEPSCAGA